jgi:hypothetical protein
MQWEDIYILWQAPDMQIDGASIPRQRIGKQWRCYAKAGCGFQRFLRNESIAMQYFLGNGFLSNTGNTLSLQRAVSDKNQGITAKWKDISAVTGIVNCVS